MPAPSIVVDVGSVEGRPGEQIAIVVRIHTAGYDVAGMQNDLTFPPKVVSPIGCAVNPDLHKDLTAFRFSAAGVRALVLGDDVDPIPDGSVLYTCTFTIASPVTPGTYALFNSHIVAASPIGELLPVVGRDAVIVVSDGRPTRTPVPTATPVRPAISLEFAEGVAGQPLTIAARLRAAGASVGGAQNDLTFDSTSVPIAVNAHGQPECAANPEVAQSSGVFAFEPTGCSGVACTGIRAIIVANGLPGGIPDGSLLYTCTVDIAAGAAVAQYPFAVSEVILSDLSGDRVPDAIGIDGSVFVLPRQPTPTPVRPGIVLTTVRGEPGTQVAVSAMLQVAGEPVVATQNDIGFDSFHAPIAARANGAPDCRVNPDIDKAATSFAFLPSGCVGTACTGVRALVLSFEDPSLIPDGSVLYTCTVTIAADAADGAYPQTVSGVILSTPSGLPVPGVVGTDGAVISGRHDGHDPNTPPSIATASASPTKGSAGVPMVPEGPVDEGGATQASDSGCQIGTRSDGGLLASLLPALGLRFIRRRRSE